MSYLIDTNIILRLAQPSHPMYHEAFNGLNILRRRGENFYLTHQNLIEFWRTCTRPTNQNGLGMTIEQSESNLAGLKNIFPILADHPEIYNQWRHLVVSYRVMGVNVHDARLVAAMLVHGITHILTFNIADFTRYAEITVVHPSQITLSP